MINLEGKSVRLRAVEPTDVDLMYRWENDPSVWRVSGTIMPFSRSMLERFLEEQRCDIFQSRQLRLIIETLADSHPVGTLDLFEFDPLACRAGVGILIYHPDDRGRGYAADALSVLAEYARNTLRLHQLWCDVGADNTASLALFRRAGFVEVGVKRDWQWSPEGYTDEIMMQKILD